MLREELSEEYDADKQAALTQLSQQKELEMMAAREGWQRKVEDLLEQVKLSCSVIASELLSDATKYLYVESECGLARIT